MAIGEGRQLGRITRESALDKVLGVAPCAIDVRAVGKISEKFAVGFDRSTGPDLLEDPILDDRPKFLVERAIRVLRAPLRVAFGSRVLLEPGKREPLLRLVSMRRTWILAQKAVITTRRVLFQRPVPMLAARRAAKSKQDDDDHDGRATDRSHGEFLRLLDRVLRRDS
ncbi:MAG: hypothetical protein JRG80_08395 [Deltaproteobacteria bacterium]|nr:hypothetical protein [Deltaproteobacteria bacterium]